MRLLIGLAASGIACGISAAHATIITAQISGAIANGYDRTGLFGKVGSLVGEHFRESFVFDTSTPGSVANIGANYLSIYGGPTGSFFPGNPGKVSFTINGITHEVADYGTFTNFIRDVSGGAVYESAQFQVGQEFVDYAIATIASNKVDFLKSITFAVPVSYYSALGNTQAYFPGGNFDAVGLLLQGGSLTSVAEPFSVAIFGLGSFALAMGRRHRV